MLNSKLRLLHQSESFTSPSKRESTSPCAQIVARVRAVASECEFEAYWSVAEEK